MPRTKSTAQKPLAPSRPTKSKVREERILMQIIVDAHGAEEHAMSWYYYLEDKLRFPFWARCVANRTVSPLHAGDRVKVVTMAPESDCQCEIFVAIRWQNRSFGVPLSQLRGIAVDQETKQAIADWHYWVQQGYGF